MVVHCANNPNPEPEVGMEATTPPPCIRPGDGMRREGPLGLLFYLIP